MRVLCFLDNLGGGGAQRQMAGLAVALKRRGHEVRFLVYHAADHFAPLLQKAGIVAERLPPCAVYRRAGEVRRVLREGWQDVVLAFLAGPNLYAELAGLPSRKWGLVVGERSVRLERGKGLRDWLPWAHRFADAVVSNSHTNRLMLERAWPGLRRKLTTIYNAVDLERFRPSCAADSGPPTGSPVRLVVAASYQRLKNMLGLAQALDHLRAEAPDSRLVVDWYGGPSPDPACLAEAREFVERRQLGDRLRFHEASREIETEYWAADAVGLFSFFEGLPNTIGEGMACGKPVILSDVCDGGSLVAEGKNGFLCDPHSAVSMALALRRFADLSPEARAQMGKASRSNAETLLNPETIVGRYERVLEAAAARQPPPPDAEWPAAIPDSARKTVAAWLRDGKQTKTRST